MYMNVEWNSRTALPSLRFSTFCSMILGGRGYFKILLKFLEILHRFLGNLRDFHSFWEHFVLTFRFFEILKHVLGIALLWFKVMFNSFENFSQSLDIIYMLWNCREVFLENLSIKIKIWWRIQMRSGEVTDFVRIYLESYFLSII